jgi:phosphoglycerol transferase MdoB-like AlkP superfamily enzyme
MQNHKASENKKLLSNFFSFFWFKFLILFASGNCFLRIYFLIIERQSLDFSAFDLFKVFAIGLFFDILTLGYLVFLPLFYHLICKKSFFENKKHQIFIRACYLIFLSIITFSFFSEIIFFDEFQARFNFIAIDYLIYTQEVIGNIFESYPMYAILSAIALIAIIIYYFSWQSFFKITQQNFAKRLKIFTTYAILMILAFISIDSNKVDKFFGNNYFKEIAWNGIYQLFSAYRNNEIDYEKFYKTIDQDQAIKELQSLISSQETNSKFLNNNSLDRLITGKKNINEQHYNIIVVAMESMSADFMNSFGSNQNLTSNLDSLAKQGLFFTNLKATGTRTVRGLEAITLSIPPTPGNSILRRPNNENLFTIASPLIERGYEAKFIYGGDGYFDNMNYFYENNGFKIVDRPKFSKDEISFNNAWGVADEDLFDKTIKEADQSFENGKKFISLVMTTSNHRPFSYPDGKIDISSKTNRDGAVKYADYAIGQLIKKAQKKKWFDQTIFLFIADHCAGSAGNIEVPIWRYQIPAIFYAPKIIRPRIYSQNASQIDIAPTLLGLMNLSYNSKFFGIDVLTNESKKNNFARSFIGTYSDLGYLEGDNLYLLKLKKEQKFFKVEFKKFGYDGSVEKETEEYDEAMLKRQIQYYQVATYLFKNDKLKNFKQKQSQ